MSLVSEFKAYARKIEPRAVAACDNEQGEALLAYELRMHTAPSPTCKAFLTDLAGSTAVQDFYTMVGREFRDADGDPENAWPVVRHLLLDLWGMIVDPVSEADTIRRSKEKEEEYESWSEQGREGYWEIYGVELDYYPQRTMRQEILFPLVSTWTDAWKTVGVEMPLERFSEFPHVYWELAQAVLDYFVINWPGLTSQDYDTLIELSTAEANIDSSYVRILEDGEEEDLGAPMHDVRWIFHYIPGNTKIDIQWGSDPLYFSRLGIQVEVATQVEIRDGRETYLRRRN